MLVLVDTNVVLSAILFPKGAAATAFVEVVENHHLFLSDYTIRELYDVFERKCKWKVLFLHFRKIEFLHSALEHFAQSKMVDSFSDFWNIAARGSYPAVTGLPPFAYV